MPLKALVTDLETVDEAHRPLYVEKDGIYVLDVEAVEGFALENVAGLKKTLSIELSGRKAAERKLEAFADLDPEAARNALAKVEEMSTWTPDDKVKEALAAREKALNDKWSKDYAGVKASLDSTTKQLEKHLLDNAIKDAITERKGNVRLLLPHVRQQVKLHKTDDGQLVPVVVGDDGEPLFSKKSGSGTAHMSIAELVETIAKTDDFAPAFQGDGATGTQGRKPPPRDARQVRLSPSARAAEAQNRLETALAEKVVRG